MTDITIEPAGSRRGGVRSFGRFLAQNPAALVGVSIVSLVLFVTAFAPLVAPYDPEKPNAAAVLQAPSWAHPFGTDVSGMDVLSRVIYAPRTDLTIALAATFLSILIGSSLGVMSGYFGRGIGGTIARISDVVQAFPLFILGMALVAATGQNATNLIYALAFLNAPIYLRLMRSQTLSVRRRTFVEASLISGNSSARTIFRHVLPNSTSPIFIQASVTIGWSILLVAGLSFVGAGVRTPTPEWV